MKSFSIIATAAMGLESVVAEEVRRLGYECQVENGKVTFEGDALAICRANLWLRGADRVKLKVGEFRATTFEELFEQTKALPWADYLPKDAEFPVIGKSVKSALFSVSDCQAIVKKAIVERLKERYRLSWFPETGPLYRVEVALHKDIATLTIDTSGVGLHKRGYRARQGEAPLRETLAAALVLLTNWTPDRPFVDPFCGSGTIAIEAALIGQNIAPGFNRDFVSEQWPWIGERAWEKARQEVEDMARYDELLDICGIDLDPQMVEMARANAAEAGLADLISFQTGRAEQFRTDKSYGVIVSNPPYGERLGEQREVEALYRAIGRAFAALDTWSVYILTAHRGFEAHYGRPATKRRKLFNGFIETHYYQYWGPRPPRRG
ncbi:THUMP domain-containing class I SAM-dependent RNA methyltransferase [Geobacillus subterraneus]|uniref:THUMP domain-containing class I SAM-dependent RNA methyltransferase n=1 Tax=Geobacillus subterraneus TaxID=129338 RepID=UPI001442A83D|nr:class I SAM-dependent RNA methyltransferase [Geobacillus subterraneus]QIZ67620.1 class I SAM-dependent RNA methyltransferase [Geobacillus subterraneus]